MPDVIGRLKFGTDGIRGVAGRELTPAFAMRLGEWAAEWMHAHNQPLRIVVGRDTRRSGAMLGAAFAAGATSRGVDCDSVGMAPTGAMSWLVRNEGYGLGVVISASHNPAPDNGIKFFEADGAKAKDATEAWISERWHEAPTGTREGAELGLLNTGHSLNAYAEWLVNLVPERLDGMKLVVDAAHGAGYHWGVEVLRRLGAEVHVIGDQPDGLNINAEGGATKPDVMMAMAVKLGAVGIAYDGDADRAVFSDEQGRLINGDRTMALWAAHWGSSPVVGTVMSNGGFEAHLKKSGIGLERTPVGDKKVSERIFQTGAKVGGEQSGHIIFAERGPTGDGLITALEFLRVLRREGKRAADLAFPFDNWPQIMWNVHVGQIAGWEQEASVQAAMQQAEAGLGAGRLVVRASGTQPMIRVMAEGPDRPAVEQAVALVGEALVAARGGEVAGKVDLTDALGD
ncbi:MAG TPA: hypothetical protein PLB31_01020 [Fimbriimonadaceae bacterium]|nr:phosphoglucosamine mutase [Armatimonadota bacterium]HRD30970.1 hypothetical protein [Fimbriimonadaceae bacterium]HRE94211.1 hypothetical protein [Fimbriimonadaceae bacterium]HRI73032.1 hypothetical protein [Fimbriimonadaceae bacterium]